MEYDNKKYTLWTWTNPLLLHRIINPVFAITELALGQRTAKEILIEKNSMATIAEKAHIPCPHCHTIHHNLKWSPQNNTAFGNWFGLYCDNCGKIIPCISNIFSCILLAISFPIWYWFKDQWKEKWLITQKNKFSQPLQFTKPDYNWWYIGLRFALFIYIFNTFINPILINKSITLQKALIALPVCILGGLLFGYLSKRFEKHIKK